jgi:hypothetical protein
MLHFAVTETVLLEALSLMKAIPAPETSWRLFAVDRDVLKMLIVQARFNLNLGFIVFNLNHDIT